ncbi:haloacid dehalogenase-like hydrolase domain-containing protein 2 [Anthonomus grandis grandis]|uniref:haloacid dehalogenase-like hydrolase domain-containing protein 2 n=1 Tax=Anthonomus grandis grandis TaxID=2921223 RepID=UPI002165D1AC|nr:haloacid dehalogenase-like hydrolase domain-containing protein 2 [Anthonomus grandis grandis]
MIKEVLIDLSGTLHIENQAIPGAIEALKRLLQNDLRVKFVTNTTKESKRILHDRLISLGFEVQKKDILSSLGACRQLIEKNKFKPMLMVAPEALEDFEGLGCPENETPDAVVIGLAPTEFHYERLNEAFRHLQNGAKLIAIHAGKYYKTSDGMSLGPGCFVKGLEYSAQCSAILVGKPNKLFFQSALSTAISPSEAVMIGDDVTDDIKGAMDAGLLGYLVKTGKYREGDEQKICPKPTAVFPSFVEAVDSIIYSITK